MILINTTFHVAHGLEDQWTAWAYDVYIRTALSAGYQLPLLMRIISEEENGGTTYALQIQAVGHSEATDWLDKLQPGLLSEIGRRWGENVLHFTTMMEEVARG